MINVMIVEDQKMIRILLESYINKKDGYQVVASIPGADIASDMCASMPIDLVLMDVRTEHRENGLTATEKIKKQYPGIKVVIATSLVDLEVLRKARACGADSLWYKDTDEETMVDVIRRTMQGEHIFPDAPPPVNVGTAKSTEFTKTELRILRYIVKGMSYAKIAEELGVEVTTVKYHVNNMLQKTNFKNKLQLALAVTDVKLIAELADDE